MSFEVRLIIFIIFSAIVFAVVGWKVTRSNKPNSMSLDNFKVFDNPREIAAHCAMIWINERTDYMMGGPSLRSRINRLGLCPREIASLMIEEKVLKPEWFIENGLAYSDLVEVIGEMS